MNIKELWLELMSGNKITNGIQVLSYEDGILSSENNADITVIPFTADNAEDWEVYHEEEESAPMFYLWVHEDPTFITIGNTYYHEDVEPTDGWAHYGEGYTREEILSR